MRLICCFFLLLPACTSQAVRCDGHLQPVNPPARGGAVSGSAGSGGGGAAHGTAIRVPPWSLP